MRASPTGVLGSVPAPDGSTFVAFRTPTVTVATASFAAAPALPPEDPKLASLHVKFTASTRFNASDMSTVVGPDGRPIRPGAGGGIR